MKGRIFFVSLAILLAAAVARGLETRTECENHMSAKSPLCSELFQSLQAALVRSETDLYNLRKVFFPSSDVTPTLINTSYELLFENVPDNPCPDAKENATFLNTSEIIYRSYGWTSHVLYTVFHPATLNRLQPQLFYTMMTAFESKTSRTVETAFYWEGVEPYLTLELFLEVRGLSCTPSYEQLDNTLKDITSVLKIYAQDQVNITTWKSSGSYVLDRRVFATDWWKYEFQVYGISSDFRLINFIIAVFVTIVLTFVFTGVLVKAKPPERIDLGNSLDTSPLTKASENQGKNPLDRQWNKFRFYRSILWTSTGILSLLCIALYTTEMVKVGIWWRHSTGGELAINIVWFVLALAYTFTFNMCLYNDIDLDKDEDIETYKVLHPSRTIVPGILLGIRFDICFFCCNASSNVATHLNKNKCCKALKKIAMLLPVVVFFLSAGFIIINIVPITLYSLIYPIRVLAFYSFVATALVLQLLALTTVDFLRRKKKKETIDLNGHFNQSKVGTYLSKSFPVYAPFLSTVFIFLLTLLFISIYRTLLPWGTTASNTLFCIIKALIPSLLTSLPMVWIVKKMKQHIDAPS